MTLPSSHRWTCTSDFVSSVIQYQNQDQRFQALEAANGTSTIHLPSTETATESSSAQLSKLAANVVAARLAGNSQAPTTKSHALESFRSIGVKEGIMIDLRDRRIGPKTNPEPGISWTRRR